ncbi:MAG: diacylglycerol O-acyltransferase / wax synthase [Solirubrobacteraceae bacterium]|jgi:WS/DGAT/MGAT family acyltransferase|nr:diacylglycerol O-acyltransferase / wax synthase [Solirubrobacteraceae bacterium]
MSPARLSALDAAFLSLESAAAPMHVGWAAVFAAPATGPRPRFEDVLAHIASRLGRAPRYRQKLASVPLGLGDPVWVDDPAFAIADHVRQAAHGDFAALVDEVLSAPLEHDRPLWELWVAASLDDGTIGVVGKAHHCLVDGLAAVELMALLLDAEPTANGAGGAGHVDGWRPRPLPSAMTLACDALSHQAEEARRIAAMAFAWARSPGAAVDGAWRAAKAVAQAAAPIAPRSRLNGALSPLRHLATHSRPMEDLRVIKRRFGTTVNDVLLAASAGALGTLGERQDVKAMVPVSVEAPDERWGNRIAFVFLELPCSEDDPVLRLRDVHVAMRSRKQGRVPEGADTVLGALALAPRAVRRVASRVIASPQLSNLTISNIPGPRVPLYLLGCEVQHAYPVVPLTDRHRLSIGMTSIHERACFGVYAHGELAADADAIATAIGAELDALLARAAA